MLRRIFNPDNVVLRFLAKAVDLFLLNLLFLLCSLPILTLGAAISALYDAVRQCVTSATDSPASRFFVVFRRELRQSIPLSLICLLLTLVSLWGYGLLENMLTQAPSDSLLNTMHMAYTILMLLPIGFCCYVFPLLSRFTFSLRGLLSVCFKLTFRHPLTTFILAFTAWQATVLTLRYALPILFAPMVLILLWSAFLEPIFRRYAPL